MMTSMTYPALFRMMVDRPAVSFAVFGGLSALALIAAYGAEYIFNLAPCVLCLYQRVPYAVIVFLGLFGFWLVEKKPALMRHAPAIMGGIAVSFLVNAGIAFYHTGVERHWWKSHLEGCAVPEMKGDITDVLAQIAATPVVRCDQIPWTDPILGLSMANYNVMFCLGLGIVALSCALVMPRPTSSQSPERP